MSYTKETYQLTGASVALEDLVKLSYLAKLLPELANTQIRHHQHGNHVSKIKGRGMSFSEVRNYQSGDDIRRMDWKTTAKTGKPHIKLFQEERERPIFLLVDAQS